MRQVLPASICAVLVAAGGTALFSGAAQADTTASGAAGNTAAPATQDSAASEIARSFPHFDQAEKQWNLINQYCVECHNFEDWAGGIALDSMTPAEVPEQADVFEKVVRKLRGHLMPPPGEPRPDNEAIKSFVSWLESYLDHAGTMHPDPGRVGLHRLNRKEYANAVRDLLDLEIDATELLPRDDASDGFDNVANVLQVSPSFLEQYIAAARMVAVQAVGDRKARPISTPYTVQGAGTQHFHVEGLPLGTRGGMVVEHYFPTDGEYELNIGNMAVALWVYNMEFEHTLIATLDGKKIFETKIGGEEDMKAIDQQQDPAVDAINARLKGIRFRTTAGPHKVAVTFVHRSFAESEDRLHLPVPGGGQDRVLRVNSFQIRGPLESTGISDTPSRKRIFICHPDAGAPEAECAKKIVTQLATRAFRRPLTESDLQPLMKAYEQGRAKGDFEEGIRRALTAILAHPFFLYRAESTPQQVVAGQSYRISDLELASRLSFFLWSSLPDDELLKLANEGKLRQPGVLEAQVRRMLADPRSETLATNFAFQWLNIGKLDEIVPDPNIFPYASAQRDYDADPRKDMREELRLFIDSIFREDRSVLELLSAKHTYLNERLALHYGIKNVKGSNFRRVELDQSARWGLLGKGAVLMATAYPNRTGPVLRGAWILENITGTPPAPPPPNVEALKENEEGKKALTVRERMIVHSKNPNCFSCHGIMDPLGFALENFDATGRWRDKDVFAGTAIDATGELPDGTKLNGPDNLRNALLSNPNQFVQTLTEKLMTYALGRTVEYHDMPTVRAIVRNAAKDNYRFSSIVLNIVNSEPFQMRRVPRENELPSTKQAALQR